VFGTQCLAGSIAQAAIQPTIALVIARLPQLRPLGVNAQQRLLQGVIDRDSAPAPFGLAP
jgi:hypothetical protein